MVCMIEELQERMKHNKVLMAQLQERLDAESLKPAGVVYYLAKNIKEEASGGIETLGHRLADVIMVEFPQEALAVQALDAKYAGVDLFHGKDEDVPLLCELVMDLTAKAELTDFIWERFAAHLKSKVGHLVTV